jgi:hypothetical protein
VRGLDDGDQSCDDLDLKVPDALDLAMVPSPADTPWKLVLSPPFFSFLPNAAKTLPSKAQGASLSDIFSRTSSLFSNIKSIAASFKRAQFFESA